MWEHGDIETWKRATWRQRHRTKPCEHKSGTPAPTSSWKREEGPSPRASSRSSALGQLDVELRALGWERKPWCVVMCSPGRRDLTRPAAPTQGQAVSCRLLCGEALGGPAELTRLCEIPAELHNSLADPCEQVGYRGGERTHGLFQKDTP